MADDPVQSAPLVRSTLAVQLTPYEWARLLVQLEADAKVWNHDQVIVVELWQKIASQLNGEPTYMVHRDNPDPAYRPALVKATVAEQSPTNGDKPARSWFQRLFS